ATGRAGNSSSKWLYVAIRLRSSLAVARVPTGKPSAAPYAPASGPVFENTGPGAPSRSLPPERAGSNPARIARLQRLNAMAMTGLMDIDPPARLSECTTTLAHLFVAVPQAHYLGPGKIG